MPDDANVDQIAMNTDASSIAFSWSDGTGYYVTALHNGQSIAVSPSSGGGLLTPTGGFATGSGYSGFVTGGGTFLQLVANFVLNNPQLLTVIIGGSTEYLPAPPISLPNGWDFIASYDPLDVTAWGPNGTAAAFVYEGSGYEFARAPFLGNYIFSNGVTTQISIDYDRPLINNHWPQFPSSPFGVIAVVNDNNEFVLNSPSGQYTYYANGVQIGDLRTKLFLDIYQDQIAYGGNAQMISLTNSGKMLLRMDLIQPVPGTSTSQESTQLFIADPTTDPSNRSAIKKDLKVVGTPANWYFPFSPIPPLGGQPYGATHDQITEQNVITTVGVRVKDDSGNQIPLPNLVPRPVLLFPVELAVDGNRDGTITLGSIADQTTPARPYRFWVNDDQDSTVTTMLGATEGDVVPVVTPDFDDAFIQCKRDLEDWTRLWINLSGSATFIKGLVQAGYSVGLQFEPLPGDTTDPLPQIKICEAAEPTGGTGYITDDATAGEQISVPYSFPIADQHGNVTIGSTPFLLPSSFWSDVDNNTPKHLLFEGCAEGKGKLKLVFYDSQNNKVGEGGALYVSIRNIKKMYQHQVLGGPNPWPSGTFEVDPDETRQAVVFVHGWQMSPLDTINFSETMYKRLWWRGFKGRFVAIRWDTYYSDAFGRVAYAGQAIDAYLAGFNDSEHNAWQTGVALKAFVNNSLPAGYTRDLVAHSMGNVVAGDALQLGMIIDNYALLQAALPAACYDDRSSLVPAPTPVTAGPRTVHLWDVDTPDNDPDPATKSLAYIGRLKNVQGTLTNFYLPADQATSYAWAVNNVLAKPPFYPEPGTDLEDGYLVNSFDYVRGAPSGQKLVKSVSLFSPPTYLTDRDEANSYACRTWARAVGAEPNTAGPIGASVDLSSDTFSPGSKGGFDKDHSAEFDWDIQKLTPFYNTLLGKLQIPTIK